MKEFITFAALVTPALAQSWHYLSIGATNNVNITNFFGNMEVPTTFPSGYPGSGGTYYLWPGLEGPQGGVLQNVLGPNKDGSTWGVYSGFCCQDGVPWGGGIDSMNGGQQIYFNNQWNSDGSWTSQTALAGQPIAASNTFQLQGHTFPKAYFAIELYDPAKWNFGPFRFTNIEIWWVGDDASNCHVENLYPFGGFKWSASGASASVSDGRVKCHFDTITLEYQTD